MHLQKQNPMVPALAGGIIGSGNLISSAAIDFHPITTALALKKIQQRVSVSPSLALVIAAHAGFLRGAR